MTDRPTLTAKIVATGAKALASPPSVYLRFRQLLNDPNFAIADVADLVNTDPATAARLLRIANSAYFGGLEGVDTVNRALVVLGTRQVHDIILATSVIRRFAGIPVKLVNIHRFWQASVLAAAAARLLADRCFIFESERMFTAGLLAQLGQLVLYLRVPSVMSKVLEITRRDDRPIHLVERELLGFDYAEVGGELLTAWKLPSSLVVPIRHHTNPAHAAERVLEASVIAIAVTLAGDGEQVTSQPDLARRVDIVALQAVGLCASDLESLRTEAGSLAREGDSLFLAAA
jgi:HD-like signal output (HDOD) protein